MLLGFLLFVAVSNAQVVFPKSNKNECRRRADNQAGVCKPVQSCPEAAEDHRRNIRPTYCRIGRYGSGVCCVSTGVATPKPFSDRITDYFEKFADECGSVSRVRISIKTTFPQRSASLLRSKRDLSLVKLQEFIAGGENARRNAWPWMALLGTGSHWFCGGALISDRHILTAAHCFSSVKKPQVVRLGEHDVGKINDSPHKDVEASRVVKYPRYRAPRIQHDIAIVILKSPVKFDNYVRPICMPKGFLSPQSDELEGTITGWGTTSFAGVASNILQQAQVRVVNKRACEAAYSSLAGFRHSFPSGFPRELFCAAEEGKDACQGDSGGPFMIQKDGKYTMEGIVSAGQGCGSKDFPGLYTWVYPYRNWIQSVVTS